MPSLRIFLLLYLSLAACFCEGRTLRTSLSQSDVHVVKLKNSSIPTKETQSENLYQGTATTGKSRIYRNQQTEDKITRRSRRKNCFQRSNIFKVLRQMQPCRVSEEHPEAMALPQRKQIKVKFQKQMRSLLVGTKWNEAKLNPSKNNARSSFTEMDYTSAHLAPSSNNR